MTAHHRGFSGTVTGTSTSAAQFQISHVMLLAVYTHLNSISALSVVSRCLHGLAGGGRHPLSGRFLRHFTQLCVPPPSEAATKTILTTILGGFLADWPQDLKGLCNPLVACATEAYNRVCTELLPTPAKSHYTFNLRDLCKVAQVSIASMQIGMDADPGLQSRSLSSGAA